MHFLQTIFFPNFNLALFVCFWKNCFVHFFSPFFGHNIRANIKNVFSHFFRRFFSLHFLLALFVCFWKNSFAHFFSPTFWSRYSCEYKKRFFALFTDDFFPKIFSSHYSCVSGKIVSCIFLSPFFGHDIRVYIKNDFSHFLQTIFSQNF